jgi:hypothetical protein
MFGPASDGSVVRPIGDSNSQPQERIMKRSIIGSIISLCSLVLINNTNAWHLDGSVRCAGNGDPFGGVKVQVSGTFTDVLGTQHPFSDFATTEASGYYFLSLPEFPGTYSANLDPATLPGDAVITSPSPVPFVFTTDDTTPSLTIDWAVQSSVCGPQKCWFTGGGAKFNSLLGINVAQQGQKHSFGGNVYPGCNPDSGDGGSWNHIAHSLKLHFHGQTIRVVDCGNVTPPPPPGSTSPVTPFNFIEFEGTGTLKGIQGNKVDYGTVNFFVRAEDRNEPGSKEANGGAFIDRYFLRVWNGSGTLLLVDLDGNPATVDPVTITDGNFQLHISSCDNP